MMWTLAIVLLACAAIFLELADRAPTLEDSSFAKRSLDGVGLGDLDVKVVNMPQRPRTRTPDRPRGTRTVTMENETV